MPQQNGHRFANIFKRTALNKKRVILFSFGWRVDPIGNNPKSLLMCYSDAIS